MDEQKRLRKEAWSGLVSEVVARPPTLGELARDCPTLVRRAREARTSATMARQSLARVLVAVEARPIDPVQLQMVRAWSGCVDDILALTDRLCGMVASA